MKTYILRDPSTVEPQHPPRPRHDDPALHALVGARSDSTKVRRYGIIGGSHDDVL